MEKKSSNFHDTTNNYHRLNKKVFTYIVIGFVVLFISICFIQNIEALSIALMIYSLLFWVIIIPACVARLHDIGKSGYYTFFALIPGAIVVMLIFLCYKEGTVDNNKYAQSENTSFYYTHVEYTNKDVNGNPPLKQSVNNKTTYIQSISTVDINRASQKDISKLYGIGPLQAKKIIKHRNKIGYYYNINEFATDLNLNKHTVESLKDKITFSKPTVNDNKDYN